MIVDAAAAFERAKLRFVGELAYLIDLDEVAVGRDGLHIEVLARSHLAARHAQAAGVAVFWALAIERLRERQREAVFAHAARACHYQALPRAAFGHRALEQLLYPLVPD